MKKLYIVKNKYDFDRIIKKRNILKNKSFIIYKENNNLPYSRFGISVGKKLGNAVYRNKMKRKIRDIIDKSNKLQIKNNDYIIILRAFAKDADYNNLKEQLLSLLYIKKGNSNEKKCKKQI